MIWYVAIVALLNLGLGYGLATMLRDSARRSALAGGDTSDYDESSNAEQ
jgi:hypothetical protein